MNIAAFRKKIWEHYEAHGRHGLAWRKTRDPYHILVSEVMLQQTQVPRVVRKYEEFLMAFPSVIALAKAPVSKVLRVWQGLGYNRRALFLKRTAEAVWKEHGGVFPRDPEKLEALPGIGQSTRGALMAFAFDRPTVFIETNIRSVFIYHFFKRRSKVRDQDILPVIEKALDKKDPRKWYYALMDYGVHLKSSLENPSRKSAHHARQSPFRGSNREVRSCIVSFILESPRKESEVADFIGKTDHDVKKNIRNLIKEGFIREKNGMLEAL